MNVMTEDHAKHHSTTCLKLNSSTTGTRHRNSSMLKLLQSPLSQTPDMMLLTFSLRRELSRSRIGSNRCASLRFSMQHMLLYTSRRNKRELPVIPSNQQPKVSFSPHTHRATNIRSSPLPQYVGRQLFIWRRSRQAGGTVPSMVHTPRLRSRVQKIQDRVLEDQLMSSSLC